VAFSLIFVYANPPPPMIHQAWINDSLRSLGSGGAPVVETIVPGESFVSGQPGSVPARVIDGRQFRRIAHALTLLAFALAGGAVGLAAHSREVASRTRHQSADAPA
jgi:hypothetical protein